MGSLGIDCMGRRCADCVSVENTVDIFSLIFIVVAFISYNNVCPRPADLATICAFYIVSFVV